MTAIKPARYMSDVPQDVSESQRSSAMPLPLYYGYDAPPAPAPASLETTSAHLRPPPFHAHAHAKGKTALALSVDPDTSTPVTRHLTTNHARKSSQAVDPFVTPFDDEYGRMPPPGLWPARSRASAHTNPNPFVAVAV